MTESPTMVVRFDADGEIEYWRTGDVRLLIIDERAPSDRVYECSAGVVTHAHIAAMVGTDRIWHLGDKPGANAMVRAALDGKPPPKPALSLVTSRDDRESPEPPAAA